MTALEKPRRNDRGKGSREKIPSPLARSLDTSQPANSAGGSRRLDIQGLRAVAVLMVVAFHAGLPVPGGFVGVDVFFVISGFVIAGLLQREWAATGRIRFGAFYLRRFKRLTPALALVVGFTAIASALLLSPLGPQQTAAKTAIGAMLLAANRVIAGTTGGYFDAPAATNPLLNTWTLSVEEQFYLAFPALLALGWFLASRSSRLKRTSVVVVGLVAAVSFGLAVRGTAGYVRPTTSWLLGFYSPVTRAWEFALGALLALALAAGRLTLHSRSLMLCLGVLGAGALEASLWLINASTPFPGTWTLLPVVGTLLLLVAGTDGSNMVTRALATRPMVKVGDWSYSIYLWHWPFIVFAALLWPGSSDALLIAAALSFAPALASYKWVEQPIRTWPRLTKPRLATLVAAVVLSPILVAGAMGSIATHYWTPRYDSGDIPIVHRGDIGQTAWHRYVRDTFYPCTPKEIRDRALTWKGVLRCQQSKPGTDISMAVIGDSHAEHLFLGLAEALPRENVVYYIVDDAPLTADENFARIVHHVAASSSIKTVVMSAFWHYRGVNGPELLTTLQPMSEAGKTIFVTDDVPSFPFDPFGCKYRQALFAPAKCSVDAEEFQRDDYSRYYPELLATVQQVPRAHMLNTTHYFCGKATCDMNRGGLLLYRDTSHLNMNGSRFLAKQILKDYPAFAAAVTQSH
jgi:peptidoglycan/LPS O-acetylase OafA/YrhL